MAKKQPPKITLKRVETKPSGPIKQFITQNGSTMTPKQVNKELKNGVNVVYKPPGAKQETPVQPLGNDWVRTKPDDKESNNFEPNK
jgi:hypothetical protein